MMRIGTGWDIHRLAEGRKLMVGGVHIPSPVGPVAHSDGDALLHALIDALLGAVAQGDIGTWFPPSDPQWRDADSIGLLRKVVAQVRQTGYRIMNIDSTIVLESPRLRPYVDTIRESIAGALGDGVTIDQVSVKAKTAEGLGAVGAGAAIEASVTVLLHRPSLKEEVLVYGGPDEADPSLWV